MLYALGTLIQNRRRSRGLTQRELANIVGVGFTTAQYWEQGIREPGIENLIRIAHAVDTPLSAFVAPLDAVEVPERVPRKRNGKAVEAVWRETHRERGRKIDDADT